MEPARGAELFELLKTLTELPGPVGHEDPVQDWLAARWGRVAQEVRRTRVGNVLARIGGRGPRLLLFGHADELCLVVKSVTDDGFLHLWHYGNDATGYPPKWFSPIYQPALVVTSTGSIDGAFAKASGHVTGGRLRDKEKTEWNDWFVDVGARSRSDVDALGIFAGARVIWNPPTRRLGRNIVGKAMDDRAALAIVTLAAERLANDDHLGYELWIGSTVQEENGLIGAASLADEVEFDRAIAVDVGLTGDHPGPDPKDFPSRLGGGPIVVYQDASCHYSRGLSDQLVAAGEQASVPVQRAVFQYYGSDGAALLRRGVETALLTYPTRYTHSPIETVDEGDVLATVDLLCAFARTDPERAA
ncbi:MAG: M28 family peptidase [Chloroflexia bacterium]|nr:M28 family peptidase [Chloroflexia bacterium]